MVSEKKLKEVKEVETLVKNYSVIGIVDMYKLPGRQLHDIRSKLRNEAKIRMSKKAVLVKVLENTKKKEMINKMQGEPALLLSNTNPFKLAKIISESKSQAPAKEGDISPKDIVVQEGPTSLAAGPVIGELQRAKIPCGVEGEKIAIKQTTTVARKGDTIDKLLSGVLAKLGIEPMEIGLNLIATLEHGVVYTKDILFVPQEKYLDDLRTAGQHAFNLSLNINYVTEDTISFLLSKAHNEAKSLAINAGIINDATIGHLLAKAHTEAESLKS